MYTIQMRKKFVIFSDSMSSLRTVGSFRIELDVIQRLNLWITSSSILKLPTTQPTLSKSGKIIVLCWIPSYVGIFNNEKADRAVKSAVSLHVNIHEISSYRSCSQSYEADFWELATVLEQLHRKQVTSCQANCRWLPTEIIPIINRNWCHILLLQQIPAWFGLPSVSWNTSH